MLMARIGGFEGISARLYLQNEIEDVLQLHVAEPRRCIEAVARVEPDLLFRNPAQCMIEDLDAPLCPFPAFGDTLVGIAVEIGDELRVIDLDDEPGLDDGA